MKIYLVGGAVRDQLLGRTVTDRDWVVVGGTPEELLDAGYQAVGGGFPVFLHPVTREEYALARTERRTGPGHRGFATWFAPDVTLEDDLRRRDLTINAMAMTPAGEVVDPYGGRKDLEDGCLRAVSPAFAEDPLRVIRVARFAAQLPGFEAHSETITLMRKMVGEGLLAELPAERVWHELNKATHGSAPDRFLEVLREAGGFEPWFMELLNARSPEPNGRFEGHERLALWCEKLGPNELRQLCNRLKAPNPVRDFLLHVQLASQRLVTWKRSAGKELLEVLERLHAFHPDSRLGAVTDFLERRYNIELASFRQAAEAAGEVRSANFVSLKGKPLGEAIQSRRAEILDQLRRL